MQPSTHLSRKVAASCKEPDVLMALMFSKYGNMQVFRFIENFSEKKITVCRPVLPVS